MKNLIENLTSVGGVENLIEDVDQEEEEEQDEAASYDPYESGTESGDEMTTTELYMQSEKRRKPKARRDLTAGQFYSGLKDLMS